MDISYDVVAFISKYFYFKKIKSSQFCWNHQNCNRVNYKTQIKLKELEIIM